MPKAFSNAPRVNTSASAERVRHQLTRWQPAQDADVVVRAGVDAVETKSAVHIADFAGLKQGQLASANGHEVGDGLTPTTNAIFGMAASADILLADLHFERGKCGRDKVELSDGTD